MQICGNPKVSLRLNLWNATLALLARNDGQRKRTLSFYDDGGFCHFELSQKAKNPRFIYVNSHFEFVDTSLSLSMTMRQFFLNASPKAQYDRI